MADFVYSNKYKVQEKIAQGGMGTVYKALDRILERVVVLKVLHPHLTSDPAFLARFLREARAMAHFQHENIVQIFAVEQDQDAAYMVMEYFPSTNLRQQLSQKGVMQLHEAIKIIHQIANALAFVHKQGRIHGDIKPENILIDHMNKVKLSDLGIAMALDQSPVTSSTVELVGTVKYVSPEQVRGASRDGRSDLYSLGLVFYELVTGTNPRAGLSSQGVIAMLISEENIPPPCFPSDSNVPKELQNVIADLLRYHPKYRIPDAETLIRRLDELPSLRDKTEARLETIDRFKSDIFVSYARQDRDRESAKVSGNLKWLPLL